MELKASVYAQFFVQKEYNQVSILDNYLIISSNTREERIPFSVWNGNIDIERGLLWGTLTFYAHLADESSTGWLVQGLPWKQCLEFANRASTAYRDWHTEQCAQLKNKLPKWNESLELLIKQPAYLPDSLVYQWRDTVFDNLANMNMTLGEAKLRMPKAMEKILPWLNEIEPLVDDRNEQWLKNERPNWEVLFSQIESTPLNLSQQNAVLINNDNNLILAGAGSGKTSVLTARIAYLLQSHLAQADQLLMLAFAKDAANEMQQRLSDKLGMDADSVTVNTFHQLGLSIIKSVEQRSVQLSPYATDSKLKKQWCGEWLQEHWLNDSNLKRWRKHLSAWPIAYLKGDEELSGQSKNSKLLSWLQAQLEQLCSANQSKKQLQQKIIENVEYPRLNSELSLVWPCYVAWKKMLKEQGQLDFHSMITRATDYVLKGKFISPWQYIMVDEYQDISPDRISLIDALCSTPSRSDAKPPSLFAVGDDWQSIFRFAGGDVDLTTGFAERFESSSIHYLDTTYRFNSKIAEVANKFIQKNPNQLEKELLSYKQQNKKSVWLCPTHKVEQQLDTLNQKTISIKTVLLLGRNHYHSPELLTDWQQRFSQLRVEFMTCHASKGKEADYVFILSVDEGQFPAVQRHKHLNTVLTESSDDFPDAEERRLFYVAMTRAKEGVWITSGSQPSSFVNELLSEDYAIAKKR